MENPGKIDLIDNHFYKLAINSEDHVFAADFVGKIFRSIDNGNTWITLNFDTTVTEVRFIGINSQDHIFIGVIIGNGSITNPYIRKIYRSTDNGESWIGLNNGLNVDTFWSITFNTDNHIFVVAESSTFPYDDIIFRSTDNGESWIPINNGGGNKYINSLVINSNNHLFMAVWDYSVFQAKVLFSSDEGNNWTEISNGLPGAYIYSLTINSNGFIFAGTQGNSVYRSINSTTFINDHSYLLTDFLLSQNYPNPFNPSTKISWQAPVSGWQTLKVYDVLGYEVATLVNEYREAGSYEVEFKSIVGSHQLANGVYFYQLKIGDYVETKKMIFLK